MMNQKLTAVFCLLIGALLGGGGVYLKIHHRIVQKITTPSSTETRLSPSTNSPTTFANPFSIQSTPTTSTPGKSGAPSTVGMTPSATQQPSKTSPIPGVQLDAAQQVKFNALSHDVQAKFADISADKKLSEQEKATRKQAVITAANARLESTILTPAQRRVFLQNEQKEQQEIARQQQQNAPTVNSSVNTANAMPGLRMNPLQKARVDALHNNSLNSALAVLKDASLSKQDQEMRLRAIYQSEMKQMMEVLNTPSSQPTSPAPIKMGPPMPLTPVPTVKVPATPK